jgi:hypothetical protein
VIRFLLDRGFPIPSPAVLGKIGREYAEEIDRFAHQNEIPVVKYYLEDRGHELRSGSLDRLHLG